MLKTISPSLLITFTAILMTSFITIASSNVSAAEPQKKNKKKQKKRPEKKVWPTGYTNTPFIPGTKWRVHDEARPRPEVVTPPPSPTLGKKAPEGATLLFDGTGFDNWLNQKGGDIKWKLLPANDVSDLPYTEVMPETGNLLSKASFGDMYLHLEFATPSVVTGNSVGRGNSGVFLMNLFELQILDSYNNKSYADGQCAALYGQYPPEKNVSLKPGEWQTYDIFFEVPRYEAGKLITKATITVYHNGVKVHCKREFMGPTKHRRTTEYPETMPETGPISLQDHKNTTRFRNIWFRPLKPGETHDI